MDKVRLGVIGLGSRGGCLLRDVFLEREDAVVTMLCDLKQDRLDRACATVKEKYGQAPASTTDYRELLSSDLVDAVVISASWESHISVTLAALHAGKAVGLEVGGAYSLEDCWQLVHTQEETGTPFMLVENCCWGRREMMVLNMVRHGLLGKVVHCDGGYMHDLRSEIVYGLDEKHYRLQNYLHRNCENYPTHELGPIANVLDINRGNRLVSLMSMASGSWGMEEYIRGKQVERLQGKRFAQGDVVTTVLRCAGGETIRMTLNTTLPRPYSRHFTVHGTKGLYQEETDSLFLDGVHNGDDFAWKRQWGNAEQYQEQYDHPVWKQYLKEGVHAGHDGMDWLAFGAFLSCVRTGEPTPLDVYDAATWMSVTALSEESIVRGGVSVVIPDFTGGKWMRRENRFPEY